MDFTSNTFFQFLIKTFIQNSAFQLFFRLYAPIRNRCRYTEGNTYILQNIFFCINFTYHTAA